MASTRMCKAALCFAASLALGGAPLYSQVGTSSPGTSQNPNGTSAGSTSGSGSMSGSDSSAGSMPRSGSAASMNDTMSANSGKVSAEDKHFMKEAMEGDMAEIKLAQLAQQKASSDQVKQFAQRMIDDHTKLDAQMKPMAQQFGVEAPTDLSTKHKAVETKLQGLSGAQFDQEYIKAMVSDHREDDQAFQREETQARDTELKNAVTQAEPIIAAHLRMAQDTEKSLKGKGSNSSM